VNQLNCELQFLGCSECDFFARFDLDRLTRCRIAAHTSCALSDLQDTKTRDPDALTLLEMLCDQSDEIADESLARTFRHLMLFGHSRRKMFERDGTVGLRRRGRLFCLSCHDVGPLGRAKMRRREEDVIRS